ncbi:hypothetical protein [Oryzibacter oryziterrae]|uniref:hypothetical protein n=1 Tax=Oryzibacter oryziterrae TaxID=2766474 RepID=UPI001F33CFCB|nr:hypothetical protein [Oryzibacter oryziterrae]
MASVVSVLLPMAAQAATSSEDYLAYIDGARAKLAQEEAAGKSIEEMGKAFDEVGAKQRSLLEDLLGKLKIKGMADEPMVSAGPAYTTDIGYDNLDGLLYADDEMTRTLLVTTRRIYDHWVAAEAKSKPDSMFVDGADKVLQYDDLVFYTVGGDASFTGYADLSLGSIDSNVFPRISVGTLSQDDDGLPEPNILLAVKSDGGKVAIATTLIKTQLKPIKACAKAKAAREAEWKKVVTTDGADSTKLGELTDAYYDCYADNLDKQKEFDALSKEAEALAAFINNPK